MINSYPHANFSRILPKCQSFTLLIICLAQDAVNGSKNGLFGDDLMPTLISSAHGGPCFVVDILWSRMVILSQLCQVIATGSFFAVVVEANIHTFEVFTSMRMAPLLQTVIRLSIRSIQQPIPNNSIASWREHNLVVVSTCIIFSARDKFLFLGRMGPASVSALTHRWLEDSVLIQFCIVRLPLAMMGRGSKRERGGDPKEWQPFSGIGHLLGDESQSPEDDRQGRGPQRGFIDLRIVHTPIVSGGETPPGGGGETPPGEGGTTPSRQRAVESAGSGSQICAAGGGETPPGGGGETPPGEGCTTPSRQRAVESAGSDSQICEALDFVDLEKEADDTCESGWWHNDWAAMAAKGAPGKRYWEQNEHWTLADLVIDPVRSQVFTLGDVGTNIIPESALATFRSGESPSSMGSVMKKCALAVLRQSLSVLGHDGRDNLPGVANWCLQEKLITPIQHEYFIFLDRHGDGDGDL